MDVGEARETAARGEIAVRRVHDELHRRRHRLVRVALGRAGRRGTRARLRRESLLDQPVDEREQRAEVVARRPDAIGAHQRGIQARDVGLHDALRDAGREEVQRGAAVRRAVALLVRGQRHARAQVRAHEQRIDDAGRGAGVGESLVAARHHLRERERGAAEHARKRGDLLDVGGRVAAHALGIGLIDRVDLVAANELAIGSGDAEVARDGLEPVRRQLATVKS